MDFWEAQRRAKSKTTLYLVLFFLLTLGVGILAEIAFRYFVHDFNDSPIPIIAIIFCLITFGVAGFEYGMYVTQGGSYVAESMGAWEISKESKDSRERQIVNIVEEMALAASLPIPRVFVLEANQINAFAAGLNPENAAICVTTGAFERLNRDELQGVIAHEMGHVYNGDMKISMRLAAMVMGFFFVLYISLRLLQLSPREEEKKGGNPIAIAGLILMLSGALTWLFGSLLKCAVSREREYLADACSVQFTRNPLAIANALRKIEKETTSDMPKEGMAYSHLYLDNHLGLSGLFATHPPLEKRIQAIEENLYGVVGEKIPPEKTKD